jgi:hypothetical protein
MLKMESDLIKEDIEIITKEDYILVKPPAGVNFWELFMTIGKLLPMPDYQEKNDIWLFRDGSVSLNFSDLQKLKDFSRKNIPKQAKGKKTAIVVSTGFQRGLAESFATVHEKHPREMRVFSDLKEAEEWVSE